MLFLLSMLRKKGATLNKSEVELNILTPKKYYRQSRGDTWAGAVVPSSQNLKSKYKAYK